MSNNPVTRALFIRGAQVLQSSSRVRPPRQKQDLQSSENFEGPFSLRRDEMKGPPVARGFMVLWPYNGKCTLDRGH